jgi:hypothetical protein
MKKIFLTFFLIMSMAFSLEISNIDPLNFGTVVAGDKSVSLSDVEVSVKGRSGKRVEIIVPETYYLEGNRMDIKVKEKIIRLDGNGHGKFKLDIKLNLDNIKEYRLLTDNLSIKVEYID